MNGLDFWNNIKDNFPMAALGASVKVMMDIVPLKQFKTWRIFFNRVIESSLVFSLSVLCGIFLAILVKSIGYSQFSESAAAIGALMGERLIKAMEVHLLRFVKNFKIDK